MDEGERALDEVTEEGEGAAELEGAVGAVAMVAVAAGSRVRGVGAGETEERRSLVFFSLLGMLECLLS